MKENNQKINKKAGIPLILIILIILVILGIIGIIAYILINGNFSKSNKEMFYSSVENIFDSENGFINKELNEYISKKNNEVYKNNIRIDFDIQSEDIVNVNNFNIQSVGQIDKANNSMEQDVKIEYSEDINNTFTLKKQDDEIGVKFEYINPNYISMKTEEFGEYEDILGIMTSLEIINNVFEFNSIKIDEGKKIAILNTCINWFSEEKFSSVNNGESKGYKLTTTFKEIDGLIQEINKLIDFDITNETTKEIISTFSKGFSKEIEENLEFADQKLEIVIYLDGNNVNKIMIVMQDSEIAIEKKMSENNNVEYVITQNIYENSDQNTENQEATEKESILNRNLKISYQDINNLNDIKETYQLEINDMKNSNKYIYNITNNVEFIENTTIEEFNDENTMYLSEPSSNVRKIFLEDVEQKLLELNKNQMNELGIDEKDNPLNYMFFRNEINSENTVNNNQREEVDTEDQEDGAEQDEDSYIDGVQESMNGVLIAANNSQFERYQGTNMQGVTVKGLMTTISVNIAKEDQSYKIEGINFNGQEYEATQENIVVITEQIEPAATYKIEFEKSELGIINRVIIIKE